MTVQIKDSDGTVRLSGDLLATGGATGDVLTQQADGTYAPASGGGAQTVLTVTTTVGDAAIRALHTTPVELAPAVVGSILTPLSVFTEFHGAAYTNDAFRFFVGPDWSTSDWGSTKTNLTQADGRLFGFDFYEDVIDNQFSDAASVGGHCAVDKPLASAGGPGTLTITVTYTIVALAS